MRRETTIDRLVQAYVALGANLGDRERNIRTAIDLLGQDPEVRVKKVSSLVENPAVGGPRGSPDFLNAVAEIETLLDPNALMHRLLLVERKLGRVRNEKWGPRTIDLDLLLYDDRVIDSPTLRIPHPRMHEREFVLRPLAEIAPKIIHPILNQPIEVLLRTLSSA